MRTRIGWILTATLALGSVISAQSVHAKAPATVREKLIGAWRLVSMEEPGADGKIHRVTDRKGILTYTRDGHMSVQIQLPQSELGLSNNYVLNGYEASFGNYEVDEATHTVTHHVEGSITPALIGKCLPRSFQFLNGRLIIRSTRPDEYWSVIWEHF